MKLLLHIFQFIFIFNNFINSQLKKNFPENKNNDWGCNSAINNFLCKNPRKIIFLLINGKPCFECHSYVFLKLNDAVKYYYLHKTHSLKRFLITRKGVYCRFVKKYKSRTKLGQYNYNDILVKHHFPEKILKTVWGNCDYNCYAKNNFDFLKYGLLSEMNSYRRIHGIQNLMVSRDIDNMAQVTATKMAYYNGKYTNKTNKFGVISEVSNRVRANLILRRLFDKFFDNYDYSNNLFCQHFWKQTQILWRSTKYVGIGVAEKNSLIYVTFVFYPKGNINKKYLENVPLVTDKLLNYNLLLNFGG
ncbi:CAP domain-containing protein [Strongyloides ratti]|uniref:CAP domain-containing protein n=1 Tax=Strongyloides ratti TaxID=34506 RepID=A0A090LR54_STRRB|nr:CAP domain-containing protein [Strongyloides ratti]CEF70652.1 CAP domain-containing protein [Strongyloides ratti]